MSRLLALLLSLVLALAEAHHCVLDFDTACSFGGDVSIKSQPNGRGVDKDNCDPLYPKEEFAAEPQFFYADAKPELKYTVAMIDPDAPAHEKGEYYLHWILSNVQGEDLQKGNLKKGTVITPYFGPAPPEGTGVHRYMFLVMEQSEGSQVEAPIGDEKRRKWNLTEWINSLHHTLKCRPVAGTQFRSQFK